MEIEKLALLYIFVLLVSVPALSQLSVSPEDASADPNNHVYFTLKFESPVQANFTAKSDGFGQIDILPKNFAADQGENQSINVWYRPYRSMQSGKYRIAFHVESENFSDSATATVEVQNPHVLDLEVSEPINCSAESFSVTLSNEGSEEEQVEVTTDNRTLLNSDLTSDSSVVVQAPYQTGKLIAESKNSYAGDSIDIDSLNCLMNKQEEKDLVSRITGYFSSVFR
jgi:hypothetical protein